MKKLYVLLLLTMAFAMNGNSQTFSTWGLASNGTIYDTLVNYGTTHSFTFSGLQSGAIGNARIVVYYEGDFGDPSENIIVYHTPSSTTIGSTNNYFSQSDCDVEDSTSIAFNALDINSWQVAGEIVFTLDPSDNVDFFCTTNRVRVRLEYDYCTFGTPIAYASLTLPQSLCPHETLALASLGTPSGGTFSGTNVTGSTFNPAGLNTGAYAISYTYTDGIGCTTTDTKTIKIKSTPEELNMLVCEGSNSPVIGSGFISNVFSNDINFTSVIDTSANYVYGPITQSPTTIYYSLFSTTDWFVLDTVTTNNSLVVDHNSLTGDDRGGMAITDSTVYIIGDNATGRYNLDLTNPVSVQVQDGLFSDLRARKLWSVYNISNSQVYDNSSNYSFDGIVALDADLNPTTDVIQLSSSITIANDWDNLMLAGYGKLGFLNSSDQHFYVIDLTSGEVEDLGIKNLSFYGSENWASWGVLSYDGTDYFANFRSDFSSNIVSYNLTTETEVAISNFSNVSDLASFIYHPGNNRVYFHYEGSGQFGGSDETIGYIDASATITPQPNGSIGCPASIEFTFNSIDLGEDILACENESPVILEAGFGFNSYTWNGVNNNWNIYPVTSAGQYVLSVTDAINCLLVDTINVVFESCAGVEELTTLKASIFPVPNNGIFEISLPSVTTISEVIVVDMNGKQVWSRKYNESLNSIQVNAENLMNGIYYVQIVSNDFNSRIPIVVAK